MRFCKLPASVLRALLLFGLCFMAHLAAEDLPRQAMEILAGNCFACHGAELKTSELDLRTTASIMKGGERGPALSPGDPDKSNLYRFASHLEKPNMPPGKKLADWQLTVLRRWIETGAPMPETPVGTPDTKASVVAMEERPITELERQFWSFRPVVRPAVPALRSKWVRNPIDAFLLAGLRKHGLQPSPPPGARTLIRRAYLDVTGLPPSPEEVDLFVGDTRPDAFERVVDHLLASPLYGERWARHWLDLGRYADSGGYEFDKDRPHAWRYRDWVIRSFNENKPYNQFIRGQIAGDEWAPQSKDAVIATTFLRLGPEANIKTERTRLDELDDVIATTSNAVLGMTVGCARCHNHKFDPIPQKDYYRMQAVFFATKAQDYPLVSDEEVSRYKTENQRIDELITPIKKEREALERPYRQRLVAEKKSRLPEYIQTALRTPLEKRSEGQKLNALQVEKTLRVEDKELKAAFTAPDQARHKELSERINSLEKSRPPALPTAMGITENGSEPPPSYFLHRGSPDAKGSRMMPGVLTVAAPREVNFPDPPPGAKTSGRRRHFSEWLTSPENPLTARVMVNRLWQHHFGEGLVRTPNNFGKTGEPPTHPELLDWLAAEFVARGWDLKAMHRLMLTSNAYRMASNDLEPGLTRDPENRLLWRMPRRRLESEAIRDAILAVAGSLDRTMGGPGVYPFIDPSLWQGSSGRSWPGKTDQDPSTWRRSIYVFSKRTIPLPMLEVFDKPDAAGSCARRNRSTTAPQALILMNNAGVILQAGKFAERVRREAGDDANRQVARAFALALGRAPSDFERREALSFISDQPEGLGDLCHALINSNEFLYVP